MLFLLLQSSWSNQLIVYASCLSTIVFSEVKKKKTKEKINYKKTYSLSDTPGLWDHDIRIVGEYMTDYYPGPMT